jgi:hypothetical protein
MFVKICITILEYLKKRVSLLILGFHVLDFVFSLFDLGCSFNVATAYQTAVVNTDVRLRTGAFTLVLYSLFHCCWGVDLGEARVPGKLN